MRTISLEKYVEMQISLAAAFCSRDGACTSEVHSDKGSYCKTLVDSILENNFVTVSEPMAKAEAMSEKKSSAEFLAWNFALEFQKSCPSNESSSEFVYRLRDMATELIHKDREAKV